MREINEKRVMRERERERYAGWKQLEIGERKIIRLETGRYRREL